MDVATSGHVFDFDISLKLIVDIEFNTLNENGLPNTTTQVLTYHIPNDAQHMEWLTSDIYPGLEASADDITQYPENLTFNNQVFNGSPVSGCELVGNHYLSSLE